MAASASIFPEDWLTFARTVEDGYRVVYVARRLVQDRPRITVWKLVYFPGRGWRNVGQFLSTGRWRQCPERYGVALSDSRLDQMLLAHTKEIVT